MSFMRESIDEIILIGGTAIAYVLLLFLQKLELISLWGSLLIIVSTALYYSYTFFRVAYPYKKLFYFLLFTLLIIGYFALVYKAYGIIDTSNGKEVKPNWLDAIYFSVVTWTTLGYGDFKPVNDLKVWVMVEALMGYIFMGLLVSKLIFLSQQRRLD